MEPIWILLAFIGIIFAVVLILHIIKGKSRSYDNAKSRKGVMDIGHNNSSIKVADCVTHAKEVMERHSITIENNDADEKESEV